MVELPYVHIIYSLSPTMTLVLKILTVCRSLLKKMSVTKLERMKKGVRQE